MGVGEKCNTELIGGRNEFPVNELIQLPDVELYQQETLLNMN